jgi:hypothetical protein
VTSLFSVFCSRIQDEWNKFGTRIVQRRNERLQRLQAVVSERESQRHAILAAQQERQSRVDAELDRLMATMADQTVALDYDATQLLAKYGSWTTKEISDPDKESKPLPCLGPRAHWIDCQTKYKADSRPCNFYVTALEECVTQTIGQSVMVAAAASSQY